MKDYVTALNSPNSQLGYGTWQAAPGEVGNGVYEALKIGYRHLVSDPDDRWTLKAVALQLDPERLHLHFLDQICFPENFR